MKNFLKPVNNVLTPISRYYLSHENVILPAAQVGLSLAESAVIFKNASEIKSTIEDAKTFVAQAKSKEEVNSIYKETLKTLTPLVLPIVFLTAAQIVVAVKSKRAMDSKDVEIKKLSDAMVAANNAIVTYQAFQKEAEKKLGAKKTDEIKEGIAKEIIKENPEKKDNSMINTTPATANEVYHYYDTFGGRYFWSTLSPSTIRERVRSTSIKFTKNEWNQYNENGEAYATVNDIYRLIDSNLILHQRGDMFGWSDATRYRSDEISEDFIDVDIHGTEDPTKPDSLVWVLNLNASPLFRTMARW
mgnify:FL=1